MIDTSDLIQLIKDTRRTVWDGLTDTTIATAYNLGCTYAESNPVPSNYPHDLSRKAQNAYYDWLGPVVWAADDVWKEFYGTSIKWEVIQRCIYDGAQGRNVVQPFVPSSSATENRYEGGCRVCGAWVPVGQGLQWKEGIPGHEYPKWLTVHNSCVS